MQKLSMDQLNRVDVETFKNQGKAPIILLLDNIRSMHNVGSAFRTADAFAMERLLLCGITATPPHREIEKTALGATQSVDWEYHKSNIDAIQQLKSAGYKIFAIEQAEGSVELQNFHPAAAEKYVFIFGNEVHGVDDEVMKLVDGTIEIPHFGTKHYFNVSVSFGIVLLDIIYKLRFS
jgi:tRNA G18 (ribose-2'-O)-methylase SpoU